MVRTGEEAGQHVPRMYYQNFDSNITEKYGVIVENWVLRKFCSPSDVASRTELKMLLAAWQSGTTRFRKLSDEELEEWREKRFQAALNESKSSEDEGEQDAEGDEDPEVVSSHAASDGHVVPSSSDITTRAAPAADRSKTNKKKRKQANPFGDVMNTVTSEDGTAIPVTKKPRKKRSDIGKPRKKRSDGVRAFEKEAEADMSVQKGRKKWKKDGLDTTMSTTSETSTTTGATANTQPPPSAVPAVAPIPAPAAAPTVNDTQPSALIMPPGNGLVLPGNGLMLMGHLPAETLFPNSGSLGQNHSSDNFFHSGTGNGLPDPLNVFNPDGTFDWGNFDVSNLAVMGGGLGVDLYGMSSQVFQ